MNANVRHESATDEREGKMHLVPVRVQCVGYRCLAYRDQAGCWRDFITHELLASVIGVVRYNLTELFSA